MNGEKEIDRNGTDVSSSLTPLLATIAAINLSGNGGPWTGMFSTQSDTTE